MIFITVSTGIGGGVVLNGRLWRGSAGLAGHIGQFPVWCADEPPTPLENLASGRWIGARSLALGGPADARGVFSKAASGDADSITLIDESAARVAQLCGALNCLLNPQVIVFGGGVGLATGYLGLVQAYLARQPLIWRTPLEVALLGYDGGIIGAAALARIKEKDA